MNLGHVFDSARTRSSPTTPAVPAGQRAGHQHAVLPQQHDVPQQQAHDGRGLTSQRATIDIVSVLPVQMDLSLHAIKCCVHLSKRVHLL